MKNRSSLFLLLGTIFAGIAVAAGAFGAHFLKSLLDPGMLAVFETAARYQMYHALGLGLVSWAVERYPDQRLAPVGWLFTCGIVLFSGSLYVLSLSGIRWLGALTPLGGAAFIAGWGLFARGLWKSRAEARSS
ncbi:MAG TPA: DUF423 domain-containing protein [Nitrospira sp.]|nr:DUF423 domain-containing protein [Nitrospira sp.]